ncbi:unnamed protein product [Sympodiomycopsis kandeliae]
MWLIPLCIHYDPFVYLVPQSLNMASSTTATELPPSFQQLLFARGVILTFQLWPSMRAAISQEWGGPDSQDKCDFIISYICDTYGGPSGSSSLGRYESPYFENAPQIPETPDQDDLAEVLEGYLADEFDARIEDDSCDFIASRIASIHKGIFISPADESQQAAEDVKNKAQEVIRPLQEAADKQKSSKNKEQDRYQSQPGFESDSDDDGGDDEEDDDMDVDQPSTSSRPPKQKQEPIVDDDGFTTVQRKR